MARRTDLNDFLRTCRARLRPADLGLPPGPGQRRVPGLRREELALLAGISVDYYIRLEQGRCDSVSEGVLDAVASALRLNEDERAYLHQLAKPTRARARAPRPQTVRAGLRQLLNAMPASPAFVYGRRMDILAWNPLACALITDFAALPVRKRNLARLILLDEGVKHLYPNREQVVGDTVGHLRIDAGRHPDDPELASLIGELSMHSEEFRRHWAMHTVKNKTHGVKEFRHPLVGEFILAYETLHLPDEPDQLLTIYTAEPGSAADDNLKILATWHPDHAPTADDATIDS